MTDACSRRNNAEVVKGVLAPFKECITLHVAFVFAVNVHLERTWVAKFVDHNRVVDDQIHWVQRVDLFCVTTKGHKCVAHRGQVDYGWNAGEVLQKHAGRAVCDFAWVLAALSTPFSECFDVVDGNRLVIFKA